MAKMSSNYLVILVSFIGVLSLGFLLGWVLKDNLSISGTAAKDRVVELHKDGKFTSPLLECDTTLGMGNQEYQTFEKKLNTAIEQKILEGNISHVSVYFRDLNNGAWFGENEKETFSPASLLKVPNAIALYKQAETNPDVLKKELTYEKVYDTSEPYFKAEQTLELYKTYTVEDLIRRMIVYSDNEAMFLLRDNFESSVFDQTYSDLGLEVPNDANPDNFMTVKTYASFFRILFNASYLPVPISETLLSMFSQVSFKKGIVAGIPEGIIVAHKFGERLFTDTNTAQLHDCGIVYYPKHPYLLCLMTRGNSYDVLASGIGDISKMIWDEVHNRYHEAVPQ